MVFKYSTCIIFIRTEREENKRMKNGDIMALPATTQTIIKDDKSLPRIVKPNNVDEWKNIIMAYLGPIDDNFRARMMSETGLSYNYLKELTRRLYELKDLVRPVNAIILLRTGDKDGFDAASTR